MIAKCIVYRTPEDLEVMPFKEKNLNDSNDGDGSECGSEDDEGGDIEQLMFTFRLEVESDIDEEEGLEDNM